MHLLITNDDGFEAAGLRSLRAVAAEFGRLTVVVPRTEYSGQGHAVTTNRRIEVQRCDDGLPGALYVCDGTPADCVRLGVTQWADEPFDAVLSGINHGANMGVDVFYSGTFSAAREAAILGLRAISISQFIRRGTAPDWSRSGEWTREVLRHLLLQPAYGARKDSRTSDRHLLEQPAAGGLIWNVNLPMPSDREPSRRVTRLSCDPLPMDYERKATGEGRWSFTYQGVYTKRLAAEGTDVAAIFDGDIALTPIELDATSAASTFSTPLPDRP